MKRGREERFMGPLGKRRGESSGLHQPSEGSQRLSTDDALAYLKSVKDIFKDNRDKYDEFLEIMKAFKAQRVDTAGVIARVKDLFKGHQSLILGFNTFLPEGYEITVPPEELPTRKPVEFNQAINYVNKIKKRFQKDEQVYKTFLDILNMYRKGNKSIDEVYREVERLFYAHQDLLEEFTRFLPDCTEPTPIPNVPASAIPSSGHISGVTSIRYSHKENVVKKEKPVTSQNNFCQSTIVKDERTSMEAENEHWKKVEKEKDQIEDWEQKEKDRGEKRSSHSRERELDVMYAHPHKRKSTRKSDDSIPKQIQTGQLGGCGGKQSLQNTAVEDSNSLRNLCSQEWGFFEKVKTKLRHSTYQEFLKCIDLHTHSIITREQLQILVVDILEKYPDLMDEFNEIVSGIANNVADVDSGEGGCTKLVKMENGRDKDKNYDREPEKENERVKAEDQERYRERDKDRHHRAKDILNSNASLLPNKEKFTNKPISELDLSNCERCTPSYRLLPKNYTKSVASYRTDLATELLNDNWVSVTSGSEDYSFKHMRKNQYEESLFCCEDDRFELDMLIESTAATTKSVKELLEKMQNNIIKRDGRIQMEDHLTAINLRCIERIYGDHGLDVLDLLRKEPAVAVPVILTRLQQKQDEWSRCRVDMNKVWAEVYAKNYHKSLDHRSFYFKQQDRKSLSAKALLQEIKDMNEKKSKEDEMLLAIAAGNRRPLIPHLKYDYPDPAIYEDLYKIIKYSCEEVCTSTEQSDKVMRIWTIFLEHMLGVPPRPNCVEDTEEGVKVRSTHVKNADAYLGGNFGGNGSSLVTTKQITSGGDIMENATTEKMTSDMLRLGNEKSSLQGFSTHRIGQSWHDDGGSFGNSGTGSKISGFGCGPADCAIQSTGKDLPLAQESERALPSLERECGPTDCKSDAFNQRCNNHEVVQGRWKVEMEEGELSPTLSPPAVVEDEENVHCYSAGDLVSGKNAILQGNDKIASRTYTSRQGKNEEFNCGVVENDAEDGEESAPKSVDDSENASDGGEDISGSEFGNGDGCSHEDNEEDVDHEDNEGKAESEGEVGEMADAPDGEEGDSFALSDRILVMSKPLSEHVYSTASSISEKGPVFYGNDTFYVLFRLHQTLYERILSAKKNALTGELNWKNVKDTAPPNLYAKFMSALYSLLDGSADNAKFEDECRAIIGTQSYMLFTLDKLIFKLVKQLQIIASDDMANKLFQLELYERSRSPSRFIDSIYHANTCTLLHGENIYRFEFSSNPYRLTIQLMEGLEKLEVIPNALEPTFSNYLYNEFLATDNYTKERHQFFLSRNIRKYASGKDVVMMSKAMKGVEIVNGLEHKISCDTSKASYVLDTEDFLFRKKQRVFVEPSRSYPDKRSLRFHRWIESII